MSRERTRLSSGGWTSAAGAVGFLSSAVFSSVFRFERAAFVLAHALVTGAFVGVWVGGTGIDPVAEMRRRWLLGAAGGLLLGLVLIHGVANQPGSIAPTGWRLSAALAWFGVVYGLADAMLLNVFPVLAVQNQPNRLVRWALALAGSLFVTALYHFGFAEFRGAALLQPLIGNAIITGGYLATGSPLTAIVAHMVMHGAAVIHGMETTVQLPPHY